MSFARFSVSEDSVLFSYKRCVIYGPNNGNTIISPKRSSIKKNK